MGGKAKPAVSDSTSFAVNPTNGAPIAPTKPVELPKGIQWESPVTAVKAASGAIPKGQGQKHVVTYAVDGDTFDTAAGLRCRVDTINAPERGKNWTQPPKPSQAYSEESTKALQQMILNKEVTIRVVRPQDKYGRAVCQVEIEGKGLDHMMVTAGAAMVYDYFAKDTLRYGALKQDEAAAKKERRGLWAEPNPINPSDFLRGK